MWKSKQYNDDLTDALSPANPLFDDGSGSVIGQPVLSGNRIMARRDDTEVMSEARMRVIYGQEEELTIKYLCRELDIDSSEAAKRLSDIKAKIDLDFHKYIASCTQDNIMILKTMLTKSLEKNDTRNSVEIMKNLDNLTMRYMEDNGLIEHKVKQDEIEIRFT